jgi:hypothetical protein
MQELRILSPTGIVGYGFPEDSFEAGLAQDPHLIASDAGSTDPGPYYLGSGKPFTSEEASRRDLTLLLRAACERGIPLVIGTAGGSGGSPHLERDTRLVLEIAKERGLSFRLATVNAELDRDFLAGELEAGRISPLGPAPQIDARTLRESTRIVAQMGVEPIIAALDEGAQVVLCGRCYDPAAFAAPAIRLGYPMAQSVHLGKLLECACIAAVPGSGSDCMMGYLGADYFEVEPLSPRRRCTVTSVAAHTLYEKSDPVHLPGPGGTLDLSECRFIERTDRRVRVTGSRFIPSDPYTVKLEGARPAGFRTISIAGVRDPVFISQADRILKDVKARTAANLGEAGTECRLDFIVYGRDGVMGALEPRTETSAHEIGIVIEAVAPTQKRASAVCSVARSTLLHHGFEGRMCTAGNLAFPYSTSDIEMGEVYTFSVYHLLQTAEPSALFARTHYEIAGGKSL